MATNNKEISAEELVQGHNLMKQLAIGEAYDKAEAAKGQQLGYTPDYGFQLNALSGGLNQAGASNGLGQVPHFTDGGKLPEHVTFSDQALLHNSVTDGVQNVGGRWVERGQSANGKDTFFPSKQQLNQANYLNRLQRYYDQERGNGIDNVVVPIPYQNIQL